MNGKPIIVSCAAVFGILCIAAKQTGIEGDKVNVSYQRPLYFDNKEVIKGGVIVITLPGGEYIIDRDDIISASSSTYEIQGGMRVWEVLVTERSSHVVRFYYSRPIELKEDREGDENDDPKLDTAKTSKSGPDKPGEVRKEKRDKESELVAPVRKEYPATTHLAMTEFRTASRDQLNDIYKEITLHVWGWSPQVERPKTARDFKAVEVEPLWKDWKNTDQN